MWCQIWSTAKLNSIKFVKNIKIPRRLRTKWRLTSQTMNLGTYVRSLTTRTNSEKHSLAAFCLISLIWQQSIEYRCVSFSINSNGVINVRKVVINASPKAEMTFKLVNSARKTYFFWKNVTTNLETKGEQIGRKINGKAKLVVVRRKMMYTILLQTNREFCVCVCVGAYCNNVM